MDIQNVALIFENQEHILIDPSLITHLCLHDLHQTVHLVTGTTCTAEKTVTADLIELTLVHVANALSKDAEFFVDPYYLFDRLTERKDVLGVTLNYAQSNQEDYAVDWNEFSEYRNNFQSTGIDAFGSLHLVISQSKTASEYKQQSK